MVGPIGLSADQGGRPATQWRQQPQLSSAGLVWASSCPIIVAWPILSGFASVLGLHLVELSLNLRFDIFCDFLSGQSVLATCILAQKYILHFSKGEVRFRGLFE